MLELYVACRVSWAVAVSRSLQQFWDFVSSGFRACCPRHIYKTELHSDNKFKKDWYELSPKPSRQAQGMSTALSTVHTGNSAEITAATEGLAKHSGRLHGPTYDCSCTSN